MLEQLSRRDLVKSIGLGALALSVGGRALAADGGLREDGPAEQAAEPVAYALPALPYGYDALEPQIEERVLRIHHQAHHAAYVKGLNATLEKLEKARAAGDFSEIKALSRDLAFHGSGHVLHSLYWQSMRPGGTEPEGDLLAAINRDFGSFESFKAQFLAASKAVEGNGWGVLAFEPVGRRLLVLQSEVHQNLAIWGAVPLMVCDVWEHAYYLQYQNRRAEYVDNFFNLVDWSAVAERYRKVLG